MRKIVKHKRYHQMNKACKIMIFRFNKYRQRIHRRKGGFLWNSGSLINYFITVILDTYDIIYFKHKIRKYHNPIDRVNSGDYKIYLQIRFWSSFNRQRRDYDELYEEEKRIEV